MKLKVTAQITGLLASIDVRNKQLLSRKDSEHLAQDIVDTMKELISKGISPVKDYGRFPKYSANYPNSVRRKYPDKAKRPVNLKLSGQQLESLTFKVRPIGPGWGIEIGYFNKEAALKEKGHQEHLAAMRPTIPRSGEELVAKIDLLIRDTIREKIKF